jgi:hypothetical protein
MSMTVYTAVTRVYTEQVRIRGDQMRRRDNAGSIMAILGALMVCAGMQSPLNWH